MGRGRVLLGVALGAAGGLVGYRAVRGPAETPALPPAVAAERHETTGRAGRLAYYVAGEGPPVLLVHSINAAGSAYEVKPIFEGLRGRRVYAVDLPGFGFSDRSARRYDPTLYVDALHDMLDLIGAPVDALALSLSSEFLARAALARPEAFRSLAFVTPTGFQRGAATGRGGDATREVRGVNATLEVPLLGEGLWALLVTRASIRYFLKRTYGGSEVDEDLVDYDWRTTHQPGARHAPFAFVSGRLFSADAPALYRGLTGPVLMTEATRGDFADFSDAGWVRGRPNWRVETFETGALPQFEDPRRFLAVYEDFLAAQEAASSSRSPSP